MYQLNMILQSESCLNLLSALLHSLWQGLIIAGILLLYLKSKSAKNANTRYAASLIALSSILICLLFTWSILNYKPVTTIQENVVTAESSNEISTILTEFQNNQPVINHTEKQNTSSSFNWKPPVIGLWLTGVLIMLFRAIYIIAGGAKLQVQCDELKDERILEIIEKLQKNLRITRKIKVATSEYITVPGVIGFFSPMLLLPVSLITGVPDEALKAILAHELAHIRRYDYLINFCQMVIEAILFFNPAVWWISRQVRIEREVCCDNAGIASIGRRIRYAEVLIQWAQQMKEHDMKTVEIAVAFGKQNDSGLLERIKRIVSTDHRPGLKVSWHIAAITLVLSIATLAALWQGTNMTVAFAGDLLTPQERIDKITEITEKYGFEKRKYGPEDEIKVSGTVRTFDGKPLPPKTYISIESNRPSNGASSSHNIHKENPSSNTGTFKGSVEFGEIYVTVTCDNYAPAFAGPFNNKPGGSIENIEIVLEQGFEAKIKVVDEEGKPIESVKLTGGYPIENSWNYSIILTTDANGIAIVEHAINKEATIDIKADGFESERFKGITLDPDNIKTLILKSSPATTGIVLSKETGAPIEGAEVRIMKSTGSDTTNGMYGEPETLTDENGRFNLSRLRSDNQYLILIRKENYNRQYLSYVTAGQNNLKAELGPKKIIKGKISGNLDKLGKDRNGVPTIWYWQYYQLGNSSSSDMQEQTQVTIEDGVGYFQIDDCWGQSVNIQAGGKSVSVNLDDDSPNDVVIELEDGQVNMREVVLNFITPEGYPPVQGGVRIDYVEPHENGYHPDWLEIQDNQASYKVPVPCKFKYKIDFNQGKKPVGYWFNEKEVEITAGDKPFNIEIPAHPAGVMYGNIIKPDGSFAERGKGFLFIVTKPEIITSPFAFNDAFNNDIIEEGKYNVSPLPLDGQYQLVVYSGNSFAIVDPVTLNRANPIVEKNVQLAKGITLKGRLLDADGTPVRDYIKLNVSLAIAGHSWGTTLDQIKPDINGRFSIENVNPDFEGKYSIEVNVRNGYRPKRQEIEDPSKPVTIQLEKGLRSTGIILDEETGWPIPGVEVRAYRVYENDSSKVFSDNIEAESPTNDKGEFVFSNMSDKSYTLSFSGLQAKESYTLTGGQVEPVIIRANIQKWSNLKPRKPD